MQTVSEPEVDDEATTANTTTTVDQVEVYGLGIFVSDVASIDLQSSTWYGDVDVYVLKYYRPFLELESALKEATRPTDRGRACDVDATDKWLFFKNEDLPELQFVNIGKSPSKNPIVQDDRFDHLRVQSEFYFSPSIAEYPFPNPNFAHYAGVAPGALGRRAVESPLFTGDVQRLCDQAQFICICG